MKYSARYSHAAIHEIERRPRQVKDIRAVAIGRSTPEYQQGIKMHRNHNAKIVATAIYDGADAVMLSAESASGKYPLKRCA